MISTYEKDRNLPVRKAAQQVVKKPHCFRRRNRLVIDIACNQNSLCLLLIGNLQNLIENVGLILQHGILIDPFSKMQIRYMQQSHNFPPNIQFLPVQGRHAQTDGAPPGSQKYNLPFPESVHPDFVPSGQLPDDPASP